MKDPASQKIRQPRVRRSPDRIAFISREVRFCVKLATDKL